VIIDFASESFDLFALCDKFADLERRYVTIDRGQIVPNAVFLHALKELLTEQGYKCETCTQAWATWRLVFELKRLVAKAAERQAEVAYWFKINPFNLTDLQRRALLANLDRLKAQQILHDGNFDPCDAETVYNLVLTATGDERKAVRARGTAQENLIARETGT
jgi:hypothetical protein